MPKDRLVDTLFHTLEKSIKSYRQLAQANIDAAGVDITIDKWLVLKTMQDNPDIPQQQIGAIVFKDFASITLIQRLVDKGFVQRAPHAEDGRRSALSLRAKGAKTVATIQPIIRSNKRSARRGIDAVDIQRAHTVLSAIVANCQPTPTSDAAVHTAGASRSSPSSVLRTPVLHQHDARQRDRQARGGDRGCHGWLLPRTFGCRHLMAATTEEQVPRLRLGTTTSTHSCAFVSPQLPRCSSALQSPARRPR